MENFEVFTSFASKKSAFHRSCEGKILQKVQWWVENFLVLRTQVLKRTFVLKIWRNFCFFWHKSRKFKNHVGLVFGGRRDCWNLRVKNVSQFLSQKFVSTYLNFLREVISTRTSEILLRHGQENCVHSQACMKRRAGPVFYWNSVKTQPREMSANELDLFSSSRHGR